jgi:hypothetical protein
MRSLRQHKLLAKFLNDNCIDKQCAQCDYYINSDVSDHKICAHPNRPKRYKTKAREVSQ